jgi:hypothetical protein
MDAKNINVLLGENWISISRINGSKNDFKDNLYYHGKQCVTTYYLLNNLFKYIINILIFWPYFSWSSLVVQNNMKPKSIMLILNMALHFKLIYIP